MANKDIIVIGASTGGIETLTQLVGTLPKDFKGSIFIVQHLAPYYKSQLDKILSKAGPLKAVFPKDGDSIERGTIYLAPPDHHLLVDKKRVHVKKGPKENRFRPSIDALFRSAAYTYGPRTIGIILSGALDDGTSGLWSVKQLGGTAIIQNPAEAMVDSMPASALKNIEVDHIVSINDVSDLLARIMKEPLPELTDPAEEELSLMKKEINIALQDNAFNMGIQEIGERTPLTCPECHGALTGIKEGTHIRYRCHTGHAFSSTALLSQVSKSVEEQLWNVLRGMEESIMLLEIAGKQYEEKREREAAGLFYKKAHVVKEQAEQIRKTIFEQEQLSEEAILQNGHGK